MAERPFVPVDELEAGMVIPGGPDRVRCAVLSTEASVETVWPLAGRPCTKVWVRREDTNEEGYMLYGPGADVEVLEAEQKEAHVRT